MAEQGGPPDRVRVVVGDDAHGVDVALQIGGQGRVDLARPVFDL
ncbi:hypothetical protein [Streptomyces niveus]|uniref:Uncharacterized protein n=1 Tax=Streptomyces niveus TaxID=193462 RepID=A0ABZ2A056_STRNV|nr:hypothetical protein [Streptomyces niveus]